MLFTNRNARRTADAVGPAADRFEDDARSMGQDVATVAGQSKDDLVKEVQRFIDAGESLLRSTAHVSGQGMSDARDRLSSRLADAQSRYEALSDTARERSREAMDTARERSREAMETADEYVRTNPWPAVGMAAGLAFIIGALTMRR